jgi:hypothetical protein
LWRIRRWPVNAFVESGRRGALGSGGGGLLCIAWNGGSIRRRRLLFLRSAAASSAEEKANVRDGGRSGEVEIGGLRFGV